MSVRHLATVVTCLAFLAIPDAALAVDESIPCDPEPTDMTIEYGDVLLGGGCILTPASDLDLFRFAGVAGDVIRLQVLRVGGTAGRPCVELLDPAGELLQSKCGATPQSHFVQLDEQLQSTGTFTIQVRESINLAINYSLSLSLVFWEQAPHLSLNRLISEQINPQVDIDVFRFFGTQHDQIRLSVLRVGGTAGRPCVELFAPDRGLVEAKCGAVPQSQLVEISTTLAASGMYTLIVREANILAMSYTLNLACVFGACAPAPFTDDPLAVGETAVKALHTVELRSRIDGLRLRHQMSPFRWTTWRILAAHDHVKAVDVTDLRAALQDVLIAAHGTLPAYTDPTIVPGQTVIKAAHIGELRAEVIALEAASP